MMVESNLPQALQHFISNSPWDHRRLLAHLRNQTRPFRQQHSTVWVIHDAIFVKKGRHSVGVHRQFARSLGRKVNCQIGVILGQSGPAGYFPLAARLYLPAAWLRENEVSARRHIPEAERQVLTRPDIALALLEEIREDGETVCPIWAESAYLSSGHFSAELTKKGFTAIENPGEDLTSTLQVFDWLKDDFGLDHFEGRNWHGWHHHVALVFTAYHFAALYRSSMDDSSESSPSRAS